MKSVKILKNFYQDLQNLLNLYKKNCVNNVLDDSAPQKTDLAFKQNKKYITS
jgi:hypothetical protein